MQFRMFEGYKVKLANVMGTTEASSTITNALYVVSSGSNDFILNYFISPEMQNRYSTTQFSSLVMSDQKEFVQVWVVRLPVLFCIYFLIEAVANNERIGNI